ncbi:LAMI_0C03598g1_1 [Lachancea mirantina]|uniref:Homoserine dehydrogenase n=1 Tax=Lachancea mirantina TaxID=1230905 RepID=A0A1G4J1L5_9SACH|nr:LAMI_0C03598g1_1 [Lachancea mirantina]
MTSINVAIIGAGVVGKAFVNQIASIKSKITFNVIHLATSKKALVSQDYKPLDLSSGWESNLAAATQTPFSLEQLLEYLKKSPEPVILVDNTSNETIAKFYPQFVANGICIATPNKKAFSSDLNLWNNIFNDKIGAGLVYHEATVGAGLPIISTLHDLINTGDKVELIEGILSGSLSFILNTFSTVNPNNTKFSEIVSKAKTLGYLEPDPRDDLNGMDFARKVTILARIAGFKVESPSAFPITSLIPKPLESVPTGEEFMSKLPDYDSSFEQLKKEAADEGKVLRYVGKVDFPNKSVTVGFQKYDASHPFASLQGSDNVLAIKTERYQNPLIVQGAGAGAEVTAAGVLADVIKIAERL